MHTYRDFSTDASADSIVDGLRNVKRPATAAHIPYPQGP
jgi:hypothetical protein